MTCTCYLFVRSILMITLHDCKLPHAVCYRGCWPRKSKADILGTFPYKVFTPCTSCPRLDASVRSYSCGGDEVSNAITSMRMLQMKNTYMPFSLRLVFWSHTSVLALLLGALVGRVTEPELGSVSSLLSSFGTALSEFGGPFTELVQT